MEITTLCYIRKDNKYLMLHRTKKENDLNEGKWLGVGGHFEKFESPHDCAIREVKEETGLDVIECKLKGMVTFILNNDFEEIMFLFDITKFSGQLIECNEGELAWIDKDKVLDLNMWQGDRIFLKLLEEEKDFFSLKLEYEEERIVSCNLDGCNRNDLIPKI